MTTERIDVLASVEATPEIVARLFWELDAEQQASFFSELDRIAGVKLCMQMAGAVDAIRKRSEAGDFSAMNGFQTMLAHAQGYAEAATDYRVWQAKREIARIGAP